MTSGESILDVENISKSFGGVQAISNVSLTLNKGDIVGIIGPNGAGKTTLVNLISGFLRPDTGVIRFKKRRISGQPPHRIANSGLVRTFQVMRPYHSLPAYKNLIIPLNSTRVKKMRAGKLGDLDAVAIDILEDIGFERDARVPYKAAGTLPLGYLKRLELARCIALKPDLILCDEIFSGLSMSEITSLIPLLEKLQMSGITLMMVEHRLRELFKLAGRVVVINFGEKIADGPPEAVMARDDVKAAYMGTEKTK
ncbi:MAG: ABC transporter ATP-binding protein [Desulfobacteraceae bacterium]|nr:ABC transporter ATP-binding protein [Desulfobacteraceae bacterium]